jgi:hypothetical protein
MEIITKQSEYVISQPNVTVSGVINQQITTVSGNDVNNKAVKVWKKFSPEIVAKLESAFGVGASVSEACFFADINRNTYYEWIRENPDLGDRFERLKQQPVLLARNTVVAAIKNNPELAFKFLRSKRSKEFGKVDDGDEQPLIPQFVQNNLNIQNNGVNAGEVAKLVVEAITGQNSEPRIIDAS